LAYFAVYEIEAILHAILEGRSETNPKFEFEMLKTLAADAF